MHGTTATSKINDTIVGIIIIILSLPRGKIRENYGTWDRWVR
jgi:hypothetical protein